MASTIQVDKIQDTGGNTILSSNSTGTFTYEAASGANFTALDADNVSAGTLAAARGGTGTTSYSPGITQCSSWRLSTNFTGTTDPIVNNWEEDDTQYSRIGSAMSNSSGNWTYPVTGIWKVEFSLSFYLNNDNSYDNQIYIYGTTDDSNYDILCRSKTAIWSGGNSFSNVYGSCIQDITSTTNCKTRFGATMSNSATAAYGNTGYNRTWVIFTRLGDT